MEQKPDCSGKSELSVECIKGNIMMDIYYYERALADSNMREESKEFYKEKIQECEDLFKSL